MGAITNEVTRRPLFSWDSARRAFPPILHGVRIAVSVSIALYIAFFLQLDRPFWAGLTAAIVAQPTLGAALRKGMFRLIGTFVGAAVAIALVAMFPQSRVGFFLSLAIWGGLCGFAATALRNFVAYAAMLAGLTAAVVALDAIPAPDQVLNIAISRASTTAIGIIVTTFVFSLTDFGGAREDLARRMLHVSQEIVSALIQTLRYQSGPLEPRRAARRALLAEVATLDAVIDQAIGESLAVRARAATLRAALAGLFSAMSSWRTIESHISERPRLATEVGAEAALSALSAEAFPEALLVEATRDPALLRDKLQRSGRILLDLRAPDLSARLLLDQTRRALLGLAQTMNGIALLRVPSSAETAAPRPVGRTFDPLDASLNGLRVALAIAASALFWIFSHWPDGPTFMTFVIIVSILYTKQDEQALDRGLSRAIGCFIAAIAAGVVKFLLLPSHESYVAFSLLLSVFLIPGGALATLPSIGATSLYFDVYFVAMLSPTNRMVYDLSAFLNNAVAIVAGSLASAGVYRLIPRLPPELRARRQVAAALRDLRRLASGLWRPSAEIWEERVYDRAIALPQTATPLQRGQLGTALGAGLAIRQLRDLVAAAGEEDGVHRVLSVLAAGDSEQARAGAAELVERLAPQAGANCPVNMQRLSACLREIEEALASHPAFFDGRG